MKQLQFRFCLVAITFVIRGFAANADSLATELPLAATKHWTADNGNGTYSNPLFYGEFEDPDVIRVGGDYHLASTTMHMKPAVEILHSKDLANWELAGYCTNKLDLGPAYRLEGGNIYGNGIWAPCIRYHNGMFYVLCQRPPGPESIMTVELHTAGLVAGDNAGLALLSSPCAGISVLQSTQGAAWQMFQGAEGGRRRGFAGAEGAAPLNYAPVIGSTNPPSHLWLRVQCNFDTDAAIFSWSADGNKLTPLGDPFQMVFQLTTFQGVPPALFNFDTSSQPGGYADFNNYVVKEPRARGVEREIPLGKTITLTSGADGSFLAGDPHRNVLLNVAADSAETSTADARFQVMDLGQERVALIAANDRLVSVVKDGVILRDLAGNAPGEAESFQSDVPPAPDQCASAAASTLRPRSPPYCTSRT